MRKAAPLLRSITCLLSLLAPAFLTAQTDVPAARADELRLMSRQAFLDEPEKWDPAGAPQGWRVAGNTVHFTLADKTTAQVYFASDEVFRLHISGPSPVPASFAVVNDRLAPVQPRLSEDKEHVILKTERLVLRFSKRDFRLSVERDGKLVLAESEAPSRAANRVLARIKLDPADRIHGLGEKAGPFRKNGESLKMWNTDAYGWGTGTDPLYLSVPFMLNANRERVWGIFFDNTWQSFFSIGKAKKDELAFGALGGDLDWWFIGGPDLASVIRDYTGLTGRSPLPPLWTLGYQQSRYSYMSQAEVLALAQEFRKRRIPADAIYLDIDFMDGNRDFTWNREQFPDPAGMIGTLHRLGFKAITILDPGIKQEPGYAPYDSGKAIQAFVRMADGSDYTGKVWPGVCVFPDFLRPEVRAWWGELYRPLLDLGFDAFWNDMNEPAVFDGTYNTMALDARHGSRGEWSHALAHNVYGHEMARATREGLERLRPQSRPWVLSRAGFAGSQRVAAFWTGDNTASWDHLKLNLTMVLNLGLSGFPVTGADVGGYVKNPSPELFSRWMELGALMPFFRNHTGKGNSPHEPWSFGQAAEDASRQAIERRYRLLPYYYNLIEEAARTGAPPVRPLFWHFGADAACLDIEDQFLLGESLMAAPVLSEGSTRRSVQFPEGGRWYDWDSGQAYEGGSRKEVAAPLESLPLFVREGSVVPVQELSQWIAGPDQRLTLRVWPLGQDGETKASIYRDNGQDLAYQGGDWLGSLVRCQRSGQRVSLSVGVTHRPQLYREAFRETLVEIQLKRKPASLSVGGTAQKITEQGQAAAGTAVWDAARSRLWFVIPSLDQDSTAEIKES